jgi:hypothetical protein
MIVLFLEFQGNHGVCDIKLGFGFMIELLWLRVLKFHISKRRKTRWNAAGST